MTGDGEATLLTRKTVYTGRVIRFDLERIALPGGHVTELEIVHHPGAALVVPFVDDDTILVIRQYRWAAGGFLLELPAGTFDGDESPEACAHRELEEETGRRAGRLEKLGVIHTTPGFSDEVIHLFAAHDLQRGRQATEDSEVLTVEELALADAHAAILDGRITDAKTTCALAHVQWRRAAAASVSSPS